MMAENVPTATITLGGKERRLAFTLGAMRRIKQATGQAIEDATERPVYEVLGAYLWAMMDKESRGELTVEDVEDELHPGNLEAVTAVFNELVGGDSEGKAGAAAA